MDEPSLDDSTDSQNLEKVADRDGQFFYCYMDDHIPFPNFPKFSELLPKVREMTVLPDDVCICAYPQSGTHWIWEVTSMLVNGKAERITKVKEENMMEFQTKETISDIPSPRVLNTHLRLKYLPENMLTDAKIISVVRNPKDVSVSSYRQIFGIKLTGYNGVFSSYLQLFLEGKVYYGSWFDYVKEWWELSKTRSNILIISYEEATRDLVKVVRKIADFLDVPRDEELQQNIAKLCTFNLMKAEKKNYSVNHSSIFKPNFSFYRTGKVANWKNWYTVAENEVMDALYNEKMADCGLDVEFTV